MSFYKEQTKKMISLIQDGQTLNVVRDFFAQLSRIRPIDTIAIINSLEPSDVVSIHVIKTKETENLISKQKLDLLKKNAIVVNTSRGGVLDEEYLIELLKSNKIFGAGLDVYSEEPPKNIEAFKNLNLISTPHIGASTSEAQLKAGLDTVENIKKLLAGDTTVAI